MTSTLAPEVVLAGRYRLVHRLASGGMGQVWRAGDEILGRPVAVKLLRSEYAEDLAFLERFRTEARRTAALSHGGIASVFDYGETDEPDPTAYLVMELVEGAPLSALLARHGRLDPQLTLDVVAQAALALGFAHRAGVVHRDVKPSNLLIRRDGVVKVTDFGIARMAGESPQTEAGVVVGTAAYLSPEQVTCRPATPASDVYALGIVAYECLAGRRPFTGEHPIALALAHHRHRPPPLPSDLPEPVRELVERAMAKDPQARPPSAAVLARHALAARAALIGDGHRRAASLPTAAPIPIGLSTTSIGLSVAAIAASGPPIGLPDEPISASGEPPCAPDPAVGAAGEPPCAPDQALGAPGGAAGAAAPSGPVGAVEQDTGEWTPVSLMFTRAWARSRRRRPLAVAAVLVVLSLVAVALTAASGQHAPTLVVPSVVGQPITRAGQALAGAGFEVREQARPDRSMRAGIVLGQQPTAGMRLASGEPITVIVSSGPASVAVDPARYLGKPLDVVRAALIRLSLRVTVAVEATDGEPGMVVGIDPSGALRQGDGVTITVAAPSYPGAQSATAAGESSGAVSLEASGPPAKKDVKETGRDRRRHGDDNGKNGSS